MLLWIIVGAIVLVILLQIESHYYLRSLWIATNDLRVPGRVYTGHEMKSLLRDEATRRT